MVIKNRDSHKQENPGLKIYSGCFYRHRFPGSVAACNVSRETLLFNPKIVTYPMILFTGYINFRTA
jgi:hypothetical protein